MCAITGLFRFQGQTSPAESEAVHRMTAAQIHRGPDDEGYFQHPRVILGHRRLAVLDLSAAGRQPMSNDDGTIHIVFNGEIYNFQELRRDLQAAGYRFRSQTDTEVLIHGYIAWGIDGLLPRLRGMFAFALFDASCAGEPRLILARDRFGIKPLYYRQDEETIVFASEVRALKAGGLISTEMDMGALLQFLQLGSIPAPLTSLKDVRVLPAGSMLVAGHQPAAPKAYWTLKNQFEVSKDLLSHEEAVEETRRLLKQTVEQHLISDVPLGIFLSGGIDSSALVRLASALRPKNLVTLSVAFEEPAYNEAVYARRVAEHYGTQHLEIPVRRAEFSADLPRIFAAMDQPTVDGVNTYIVSKAAHEAGLTVVLSGLGADELFSGYRHLRRARQIEARLRAAALVPDSLRRLLLRGLHPLVKELFPRQARKMWCLEHISAATPWWMARGLFSPTQIAELVGVRTEDYRCAQLDSAPPSALKGLSPEERVRYLEYALYLQNQLLKDGDVMSMAHSLELRVPFMDHELVARVLRLPTGAERAPSIPKLLLVEAMGPDFPSHVWARPKQGFTFPLDAWLRRDNGDLEAMATHNSPLEKTAVRKVWSDFRAGRLHWSRPWMTVVAATFYGT